MANVLRQHVSKQLALQVKQHSDSASHRWTQHCSQ